MKPPTVIGLVVLGACALLLLGILIRHDRANKTTDVAARPASADHTATTSRLTKTEENKIILGNVAAVPFQELYGLLSRRTAQEIAELARQLQSLPRSPKAEANIAAFFKAWATLDATAAFALAASFRPDLRDNAIGAVLEGADVNVAATLVTSIKALPAGSLSPNSRSRLLGVAVGKWSRTDPIAAAKFLDSSGERGMNFSMAWSETASNWAAIDPVAALAWAQRSEQGGESFAMSGAILGWWKNDPQAAETYVASHLETTEGQQLAGTLASNMLNSDPEKAKDWVSHLANVEARKKGELMIAIQWGFNDPAAATQWTATLPADERAVTLASTIGLWARQDPAGAGEWLNSYDGAGRDMAVETFSLNVASKDPAGALTWVATISDSKLRESSEQQIAGDWLKQNPQAAAGWIQNSSMTEAEKARLLAPGK